MHSQPTSLDDDYYITVTLSRICDEHYKAKEKFQPNTLIYLELTQRLHLMRTL